MAKESVDQQTGSPVAAPSQTEAVRPQIQIDDSKIMRDFTPIFVA